MTVKTVLTPADVISEIDRIIAENRKLDAKEEILKEKRAALRHRAGEILSNANATKMQGKRGGHIQYVQPSVSNNYDKQAIDVLCQHDPHLDELLAPHRKVTTRAGYIKICP